MDAEMRQRLLAELPKWAAAQPDPNAEILYIHHHVFSPNSMEREIESGGEAGDALLEFFERLLEHHELEVVLEKMEKGHLSESSLEAP